MAKILWLNWSGGGNLPPSLGVARIATERGHSVSFAGRPEMVPRVRTAGFRAIEISSAYRQVDLYPQGSFLTRMSCYLTSPEVEREIAQILDHEDYDVLAIDAMFPAALEQARRVGAPKVVFLHTFLFRQLDMWRRIFTTFNDMRQKAGFSALPGPDELWRSCDRLVSTSLAGFDAPAEPGWELVRHVGPVLEDEKFAAPANLPWTLDDPTPLVLVSFSTGFEQRNVVKLQNALDALARLPVHVVATTGGIVSPHELAAPANALVLDYAAHDPILRRAAMVLTHGGHGTAMRALRAGTPLVVVPGLAGDQPYVAAAVQEWGAGLALPGDAGADAMHEAARTILSDPAFRAAALERQSMLAGAGGASAAVDLLEELAETADAVSWSDAPR